jgi:hypothetical protein
MIYVDCTGEWAGGGKGSCNGYFLDGSPPFTGHAKGTTQWQDMATSALPPRVGAIPSAGERLIKITQATDSGKQINCYIANRSSGVCYTDHDQVGKPTGQPGGPLSLVAQFPTFGQDYVFVRGFCRKGDPLCTPH